MNPNLITVDGKSYDPAALPPSVMHVIQLFVRAQNDLAQKAMDVEIATAAVTTLNAQMRGALTAVPEHVPPAPAPAPAPATEAEDKVEAG